MIGFISVRKQKDFCNIVLVEVGTSIPETSVVVREREVVNDPISVIVHEEVLQVLTISVRGISRKPGKETAKDKVMV